MLSIGYLYILTMTALILSVHLSNIRFKPLFVIQHISILPLGLGNQKIGNQRPEKIAHEKNPQHVRVTDYSRSAEIVEEEGREYGAYLAGCGTDAVTEAAHAGGEDFGGDDEGGGVGAEVEEELRENMLGRGRLGGEGVGT